MSVRARSVQDVFQNPARIHLWSRREVEDLKYGVPGRQENKTKTRQRESATLCLGIDKREVAYASMRDVSTTLPLWMLNEMPLRNKIAVTATPISVADTVSVTLPYAYAHSFRDQLP